MWTAAVSAVEEHHRGRTLVAPSQSFPPPSSVPALLAARLHRRADNDWHQRDGHVSLNLCCNGPSSCLRWLAGRSTCSGQEAQRHARAIAPARRRKVRKSEWKRPHLFPYRDIDCPLSRAHSYPSSIQLKGKKPSWLRFAVLCPGQDATARCVGTDGYVGGMPFTDRYTGS